MVKFNYRYQGFKHLAGPSEKPCSWSFELFWTFYHFDCVVCPGERKEPHLAGCLQVVPSQELQLLTTSMISDKDFHGTGNNCFLLTKWQPLQKSLTEKSFEYLSFLGSLVRILWNGDLFGGKSFIFNSVYGVESGAQPLADLPHEEEVGEQAVAQHRLLELGKSDLRITSIL